MRDCVSWLPPRHAWQRRPVMCAFNHVLLSRYRTDCIAGDPVPM